MGQLGLSFEPELRIFTVGELTDEVAEVLSTGFRNIWVRGEVSGFKLHTSGHCYFSLKDSRALLKCVCYKMVYRYLKVRPEDGKQIKARGRLDVYAPRGDYQFIIEAVELEGEGALLAAFEQLKKRLAMEGLFEPSRKRPLPSLPGRIGIVTSPTGAVIRDMLHILKRRFPGLHVRLYPSLVQGAGAVESVCEGLRYFSESGWPDVVILARGGGSLEDLWTFNEEAVARAIALSKAPVISAIGHETDFTIADFVADLRAPTPSAAAELVVPTKQSLLDQSGAIEFRLGQAIRYRLTHAARRLSEQGIGRAQVLIQRRLNTAAQRVDDLESTLREGLRERLRVQRRRWQVLEHRLTRQDVRLLLGRMRERFAALDAHLTQLSPLKILERGYAVVQEETGQVVKDSSAVVPDQPLNVRLFKGRLRVRVSEWVD